MVWHKVKRPWFGPLSECVVRRALGRHVVAKSRPWTRASADGPSTTGEDEMSIRSDMRPMSPLNQTSDGTANSDQRLRFSCGALNQIGYQQHPFFTSAFRPVCGKSPPMPDREAPTIARVPHMRSMAAAARRRALSLNFCILLSNDQSGAQVPGL